MSGDPRIAEALARLPDYLGSHVLVSITALALGLAVSLPLALISRHRPALRALLLGMASIVKRPRRYGTRPEAEKVVLDTSDRGRGRRGAEAHVPRPVQLPALTRQRCPFPAVAR